MPHSMSDGIEGNTPPRYQRFVNRPSKAVLVPLFLVAVAWTAVLGIAQAAEPASVEVFEKQIQPLLVDYCYDCHGYGASEGNLTLDHFKTADDALADPELWWKVIKNLRAGVMPPLGSEKLDADQQQQIYEWVKFGPFGIDPDNPDPGPVTVRRLNREEYGNTVRALMGIRFDEKLIFPPDDSGHGFDNVADALMVSPLLLEKYLQAAEFVVDRAVPKVTKIIPRQDFRGEDFRSEDSGRTGRGLDGKEPALVAKRFAIDANGEYDVDIAIMQHGSFEFDPARYDIACTIDGQERFAVELGWDERKVTRFHYREDWEAGEHEIVFELTPVEVEASDDELMEEDDTSVTLEIDSVSVEGPVGTDQLVHPANYERFFPRDEPPTDPQERRDYAHEILSAFATKAFRSEADAATLDRLVDIAEATYDLPNTTFESGIARAIVAVLASPKFLFRIESIQEVPAGSSFAPVDEMTLATRLSYFLWSSVPDEELSVLAGKGVLREQLPEQVDRMLADPKADVFVSNFVGQWLRTRDVAQVSVDPAVVLGVAEELEELRDWFRSQFRRRGRRGSGEMSEEDQAKMTRFREIRGILERIDGELKDAIQSETEEFVEYVLRNDVSMLDLLDCNYTFLNEKLAEHYGIEGVEGRRMRRVELPEDSPRGGVLTQASMLLVTSNPTRTSPVKRGLFILDNILGTPAPPAPAAVPELEASADRFEGRTPSLRELLAVHRESDLCSSCHSRMDPLGLALENFDALGMWRETANGDAIEPQGELVTGEKFDNIVGLKRILRENHADSFYRCVTQKLMIYALGRGIEYSDEHTIDTIVDRLRNDGGKFNTLVHAVVASTPFQMQRLSTAENKNSVASAAQ